MDRQQIFNAVCQGLSATLELDVEKITIESSLIDDLGAESIDLLDFNFRMERAFGIEIADDELFRGQFDIHDEGLIEAGRVTEVGMERLREVLPGLVFDRFKDGVILESDLPRLMTVRTLVNYFENRLCRESPS